MRVGIFGTGAIGGYVGGALADAGLDVTFLARPQVAALLSDGLTLEWRSERRRVARLAVVTDSAALAGSDLVILCVKSRDTARAAEEIAASLPPSVPVVSLQNGVRNVSALTERLGRTRVIAGMIFFNVVWRRPATFRRTTGGPILIERSPDPTVRTRLEKLCGRLGAAGLEASLRDDLPAVQTTKLLFNLNNALCALTDRTIREELLARDCRVVLAAAIREGLEVVTRAGLPLARLGKLDPRLAVRVLGLPTPLFRVVAKGMLEIDPEARSSMWEDLTAGKPTEIEYLNGELVTMAERAGMQAPVNAAIVGLIRAAEARGGSPALSPADLRRAVLG